MGPAPSDSPTRPIPSLSDLWRWDLQRTLTALSPSRRRQLRSFAASAQGLVPQDGGDAAPLLDLASNDYLGLSRHPAVTTAAAAELQRSGLGAGGSRLVSGSRPVHQALETALASWLGRERALLFPSGFQANLAAVGALADRHSLVLADRLIHHSLLCGVRAAGAQLQRFGHNDLHDLERHLAAARAAAPQRRLLVLSESLFSMQGTSPAVPQLVELCQRHGAALLLDEAHALGVLGPGGRGLGHGQAAIALISGTFGKALGSGGAFVAGDADTLEALLQTSGAFRYTTALAPPLAAGALAALAWIQQQDAERQDPGELLRQRARRWREVLAAAGWPRPAGEGPILPLLVGDDERALQLQHQLERDGLLCVAIRPPTVPAGSARLRIVLRRDLPAGTLPRLLSALGQP
ncbi:MAG: aminotransferase class I/II-fold pyridoxal phosphate-dependent enzyme [Cyanobacteria bacterium M_surface_7_m2_040]|nr:aminotransferase class I/II-fold pyridoxal phosphate-dependent enzyme [Cyanobacteria bacterium M_surface_7_m2_040]